MPPPRKRATRPADLETKRAADADLQALRDEVAAEPEADDDGFFAIPLGDRIVRVKNFLDWPSSANDDLAFGRMTRWALKVLDRDDFEKIWAPMDPTNRQAIEFMQQLEKITGIPLATLLTSLSS